MDPARYLALFVEEATDHLGEMGRAFLRLEKDPASAEALEVCFRMAHSIKGMAASMRFDPIAARAHALEDFFTGARDLGRVDPVADLPRFFAELDGLERMIGVVRATGACPAESAPAPLHAEPAGLKKKLRTPPHTA
jgi:two-component system chemotaxis sensor kinase CheA